MIEIINVTKKYKDKTALDNINLTLNKGIYGFLGANGAGKTTLINIIAGIKKATSGAVTYEGKDIFELGSRYREIIGFLPQKVLIYSNFKVYEFIMYMCLLKGIKEKSKAVEETDRVLALVNLEDVKKKKIGQLSGGMHQRLAVAQAIIGNPKLVLLDEPTVGLDPEERIRFKDIIKNISKEATVIISTHILSDLTELADNLCMFKNGKLIYFGKRSEWDKENIDKKYLDIMEGAND